MRKSVDVHHRHRSLECYVGAVKCPTSMDPHPVPHRIGHNQQEYKGLIMPIILNKYHAQYLLGDLDQSIPTNAFLRQDKDVFVRIPHRQDVTNLALVYDVAQGIANWLNNNN